MTEVRIAWRPTISHREGASRLDGHWLDATLENVRSLQVILEMMLEDYGPGSHWMEERLATEIRLGWKRGIVHSEEKYWVTMAAWHCDSRPRRRSLEAIASFANRKYGPGSHWVEERERLKDMGLIGTCG